MKVTWCYDASTLRPLERSFFARERTHTFNAEGSDVRRLMLEKRDGRVSATAATAGLFRSAATQALKSIDQPSLAAEITLLPPGCLLPTKGPRESGLVVILDVMRGLCIVTMADLGPLRIPLSL